MYVCTCHVSAMSVCGTTACLPACLPACNPPAADTRVTRTSTREQASRHNSGHREHPIIADRMPRTEGSFRLVPSTARTFSLLSPTSHNGPPLRPRAPARFAFLREKHPKASSLASLYTPALRGSLAPLANLATVRLPHRAHPPSPAPCLRSPIRPRRWRLQ
jgi:hypothetical protein